MSKLTGRSKKDIFFPSTGLEQDRNNKPVKKLTGENTSEIKKDESGKDYSLIRETTENFIKGDTIKPGNLPRVDNFIQGGDYKVSETPESKKRATDEPRTFSAVRLENKYSSMKSMGQAISKWTSPHKLIGEASPMEQEGLTPTYYDKKKRKEQKEKYKDIDKKEAKEKGVNYRSDEKIERQAKRDEKKAYRETDEGKAERKVEITKDIQTIGSFLADLKPGGTKVKKAGVAAEQPKEDKDKDKDKDKKVDSGVKNLDNLTKTFTTS